MRLVLDSNEYIFGFGIAKEQTSRNLFQYIRNHPHLHTIHICRTIIKEITDNLSEPVARDFYNFISGFAIVDEDYVVPFQLGAKYEKLGLKPGDAFIAAYAEYVQADFLISENRHFLSRGTGLPFQVLTAEDCLKKLRSTR